MRLLLDTHILLSILREALDERGSSLERLLSPGRNEIFVSCVTLWEISIKTRLGKLDPGLPLDRIASFAEQFGATILAIDKNHAIESADPLPVTRDPFDRMLLAQCKVEGLQLVTFDRSLVGHPLAWTP